MNQDEWEEKIIKHMVESGWVNDRNDETIIGFSQVEAEHHWIRDYDKKTHRFVQFDGNRKVDLV